MNDDLISNNFADNINKSLVKKGLAFTKTLLNLVIIYSILNLLDWYLFVSRSMRYHLVSFNDYYSYRIHPVVAVIVLSMGIVTSMFHVKANRLILLSFEKEDAELFNAGCLFSVQAMRLSIISFIVSLISVATRIFIK
jgi:hypothetical protein